MNKMNNLIQDLNSGTLKKKKEDKEKDGLDPYGDEYGNEYDPYYDEQY